MNDSCDVAILGGGPAGAMAAITLKKRHPELKISVFEASQYENWRVGETLSPLAGQLFRSLEIWDSFLSLNQLSACGTCAIWEEETLIENEYIFQAEGRGWHLDRVKFDHWLIQEAEKLGILILKDARYLRHDFNGERFILDFKTTDETRQFKANYVIDSMGRSSLFLKKEGGNHTVYDRLTACIGIFNSPLIPSTTSTYSLVEAVENGWWYSTYLPNNQLVIVFMTDSDLVKKNAFVDQEVFRNNLEETSYTKMRLTPNPKIAQFKILSASSILQHKVAGKNWLAIGDAASTFDPLSSQGIYKSMRSGVFGAYALSDLISKKATDFSKYERFINEEYQEYLTVKNGYYGKVKKWPNSKFWSRRMVSELAY